VLQAADVDAVVVATPVSTHFSIARRALEKGKHVFVEKPMTSSVVEGESWWRWRRKTVGADGGPHLHLYRRGAQDEGDHWQGRVGRFVLFRLGAVNLGLFQHDADVLGTGAA